MKPLSPRDQVQIQNAILEIYAPRDMQSFRAAIPGFFMAMIPAERFSLVHLARGSFRPVDILESRPLRVGMPAQDIECMVFEHPFLKPMLRQKDFRALRLSDFLSLRELRRSHVYRQVLRPANIGRLLAIRSGSGPGLVTLNLSRPESARDFTERDRRILEALRPHFDQARTNLMHESMLRASRTRSLRASGLTPREIEVALWLAQGKTNPEVALILRAPVRTIEKHVEHVLSKLGVENRTAAAVAVARIIGA